MDASTVHAALAAHLQVTPAKLRLEDAEGGGWLLFMPDHRFPLAKATVDDGDASLTVTAENGHPIEGEEGLFHHDARDHWLADEIAAHEAAKDGDHFHPAKVALRHARGKPRGKLVGRIRVPLPKAGA